MNFYITYRLEKKVYGIEICQKNSVKTLGVVRQPPNIRLEYALGHYLKLSIKKKSAAFLDGVDLMGQRIMLHSQFYMNSLIFVGEIIEVKYPDDENEMIEIKTNALDKTLWQLD